MLRLGPRLVVAGTQSGVGKTTVATGIMAALRRRGVAVAAAKVGPDFVDPGYHAVATGRPGRNLDAWMCGPEAVPPLAARAAAGCDVLVVEGVMGLFDGAFDADSPQLRAGFASTAHVAMLLDAPVVLVVDAAAIAGSVAALVHGFATYEPAVRLAGVILNRVGSDGHEAILRAALAGASPGGPNAPPVPVLGVLRRDGAMTWRDRHLGLVPVVEHAAEVRRSLDALAEATRQGCDLEGLLAVARAAPAAGAEPLPAARISGRARVAVARGPAFSFYYEDNFELLEEAGAELVPFDPEDAAALPDAVDGLYAGGGFPEVFAARLAANRPLLDDVRRRVAAGLVTWAECGGLLWLARSLDGRPMAGVIEADARMTDRLTLGYRRARPRGDTPLAAAGTTVRGHEFHYSVLEPAGDTLELRGLEGLTGGGFATGTLLGSYLHVHLAGHPHLAERFVATASASRPTPP